MRGAVGSTTVPTANGGPPGPTAQEPETASKQQYHSGSHGNWWFRTLVRLAGRKSGVRRLYHACLNLSDTRSYREVGLVFVFSVRPDDHCKIDDFCDEASRVLC